jgi:DNA processing protein
VTAARTHAHDDDQLFHLLLLLSLPGVGPGTARKLLHRYRTPRAAVRAARAASGDHEFLHERARRGVRALRELGAAVLLESDVHYPAMFRTLAEPPLLVFALGNAHLTERRRVAIVGTRRSTEYGAEAARMLAKGLVRAGVVIVSGLARGIDSCAHEAALESGGDTIALLGTGIDVAYPPEHAPLQARIAERGLLLTEVPPGMSAFAHHFPRRNRLIAALSEAVVVVEAPPRSGALNTATLALEMGREVLAVPGPIGRETSMGTHALLRDGATLVTSVDDVLETLKLGPLPVAAPSDVAPPAGTGAILAAIGSEACHVDDVAAHCGMRGADALCALLELELSGWVRQLPGKRFVRAEA